jgi:hypothetical protein
LNLESIIKSLSRETKSQYRDINNESILQEVWDRLPDNSISIKELIEAQKDYLGYVNVQLDTDKNNCMVMNINTKYKPKLTLMSLATGKKIIAKTTKRIAAEIKENDFIKVHKWDRKPSWTKDENDKWVQDKSRMEWHVKSIERIKESDL